MKTAAWIVAIAWIMAVGLGASCSAVPPLRRAQPPEASRLLKRCQAHFPGGTWQVVHTIEFRLPLGKRSALLGVVTGDVDRSSLRLTALAPEGMTLLGVTSAPGSLQIKQAVPPFTRRSLQSQDPIRSRFVSQVALRAHETVGYSLNLRLLRVTRPLPAPR